MSNINIYLEKILKWTKLCVGPTMASPGPTLLIVAATAVKLVVKSFPSKESARSDALKMNRNVIK